MNTLNIGKENATFQELYALKENRTKRIQQKRFFVEGVQNIKDAISNNWKIVNFIYSDYNSLSDWAKSVLNLAKQNFCVTEDLMKKLSDKDDVSELLAIIEMKKQENSKLSKNPLIVLLDRPSKKGNFGTIIRSCDALYVDQIYFTGHAVDIYDHNVITSSMGSFFKVPFKFLSSNNEYEELLDKLKKQFKNFQIVATSLQSNTKIQDCDFKKPTLLLIGNEAKGLSRYYIETATKLVKINMKTGIDSLNVACATTACLYEISRQRIL